MSNWASFYLCACSFVFWIRAAAQDPTQHISRGMRNRTHYYDGYRNNNITLLSNRLNATGGDSGPQHPIRHERHRTRPRDYFLQRLKNTTSQDGIFHENRTAHLFTTPSPLRSSDLEISVFKLEPHENCFNSNEVLEIIAVTCLVNFAFWFLIITCVNFHTRGQQLFKSESCDVLLGNEGNPHSSHICEVHHTPDTPPSSCSSGEQHYLQKYFDPSPSEPAEDCNPFEDASLPQVVRERSRRLSNLLNEIISMDNLRPSYGKLCTEPRLSRHHSYSMENLIF